MVTSVLQISTLFIQSKGVTSFTNERSYTEGTHVACRENGRCKGTLRVSRVSISLSLTTPIVTLITFFVVKGVHIQFRLFSSIKRSYKILWSTIQCLDGFSFRLFPFVCTDVNKYEDDTLKVFVLLFIKIERYSSSIH